MYVSYTGISRLVDGRYITIFKVKFNKWGSYVGLWKNRPSECEWIVPGTIQPEDL